MPAGSTNNRSLLWQRAHQGYPGQPTRRLLSMDFGNQAFKQWQQNQSNHLVWINGDPGKGKTMLLCGIIEELIQYISMEIVRSSHFSSVKPPTIGLLVQGACEIAIMHVAGNFLRKPAEVHL